MLIGWFGRPFNYKHKSLATKTHIVNEEKVLCGYKPHKTMEFQWCKTIEGIDELDYVECNKCKEKYIKK